MRGLFYSSTSTSAGCSPINTFTAAFTVWGSASFDTYRTGSKFETIDQLFCFIRSCHSFCVIPYIIRSSYLPDLMTCSLNSPSFVMPIFSIIRPDEGLRFRCDAWILCSPLSAKPYSSMRYAASVAYPLFQ